MLAAQLFVPVRLVVRLASFAAIVGIPLLTRVQAQEPESKRPAELLVSEGDVVTRKAVCRWAEEPPVLDGKLDDRCWKTATVIDRFRHVLDESQKIDPGYVGLPGLG